MKPIIGIGGSIDRAGRVFAYEHYITAVHQAGGIPIILPHIQDESILDILQGVIITGGDDIPADMFGEKPVCKINPEKKQRLQNDLWLIQRLRQRNIPTLGICYGMQLVNVALGGKLYQDIRTQHPDAINHLQKGNALAHSITIISGTTLADIHNRISPATVMVNSTHHQAVKGIASPAGAALPAGTAPLAGMASPSVAASPADVGQGLVVSAVSPDGIVEAIESVDGWFLGVQWHPERIDGELSRQIFSWVVDRRL